MEIATIGFTKRTAEGFFGALSRPGLVRVIDVRANNRSQLAGFTRASDLPFFLERLVGLGYRHEPLLCPDRDLLRSYRRREMPWDDYADAYITQLEVGRVADLLDPTEFDGAVLLCSEPSPEQCHRRLAAKYLQQRWREVTITDL